jgi:hypothetical protein
MRSTAKNSDSSSESSRSKKGFNFKKLVKKGRVNMKPEQKYLATPIME